MAESNPIAINDPPPPEMPDLPANFTADPEMVRKVSVRLNVHPDWVKQAIYLCEYSDNEDEVCAYILENHPRFEEIPSSSSNSHSSDADAMDIESQTKPEFMMAIVVNAEINMGTGKTAAQVAQAMVEFCCDNHSADDFQQWKQEKAYKSVLECKNADQLYTLNSLAECDDLKTHYVNDSAESVTKGIGAVTVLLVFGRTAMVEELTQTLQPAP